MQTLHAEYYHDTGSLREAVREAHLDTDKFY